MIRSVEDQSVSTLQVAVLRNLRVEKVVRLDLWPPDLLRPSALCAGRRFARCAQAEIWLLLLMECFWLTSDCLLCEL